MALDSFASVYSRLAWIELFFEPTRLSTVMDRSGELQSGGESLYIPGFKTDVSTAANPAVGTSLTFDEVDDSQTRLQLNQDRYTAFRIPDTQTQYHVANVTEHIIRQQVRAMRQYVNDRLRADFESSTPATGNVFNVALKTDGSTASTPAKIDNEAGVRAILHGMDEAATRAISLGWPESRYAVISPRIWQVINRWLYDFKPNLGVGMLVDGAFTQFRLPTLFGFQLLLDPRIGGASNAAATDQYKMSMGIFGETQHFAMTIASMDLTRDPYEFATLSRTHWLFGTAIPDSEKQIEVNLDFTT